MKMKKPLFLIIVIIVTLTTCVTFGYSAWKIDKRAIGGFQSYDVSNVDGVTISNTSSLEIKIFSYNSDTISYVINSSEIDSLKLTLEVVDATIVSDFISTVKLDNSNCSYQIVDGKIEVELNSLTLNTNHTIDFQFSVSAIYNANFNTSGILSNASQTLLIVYNGE